MKNGAVFTHELQSWHSKDPLCLFSLHCCKNVVISTLYFLHNVMPPAYSECMFFSWNLSLAFPDFWDKLNLLPIWKMTTCLHWSFLHCLSVGLYAKDPEDKKHSHWKKQTATISSYFLSSRKPFLFTFAWSKMSSSVRTHTPNWKWQREHRRKNMRQSMKCYIYSTPRKSREIVDPFSFTFISVFCVLQSNCAALNSIETRNKESKHKTAHQLAYLLAMN